MSAINLSEVLKLPVQERIRIVEAIWDSVAEHPEQARVGCAEVRSASVV